MRLRMNLINNDCLVAMKNLSDGCVDSVITDPPYNLIKSNSGFERGKNSPYTRTAKGGFMGKEWDGTGVALKIDLWREVLRIAKPGAFLLCFGGTRTYHRIACAIEDAGWEIRDCIMWVYGSGFPKSLDIGKAMDKQKINYGWNGYGTALKPAYEPIIVAMRSIDGTFVNNALKHGVSGLNIDDSRIPVNSNIDDKRLGGQGEWKTDKCAKNVYEGGYAGNNIKSSENGRFPANFIHDGSQEVLDLFPNTKSGAMKKPYKYKNNGFSFGKPIGETKQIHDSNEGSASRFFYCAKASRAERDKGLENCGEKAKCDLDKMGGSKCTMKTGSGNERNVKYKNHHPTVKPIKLMEYLCRLTRTPSGGIVLDPFMGSGTTGIACINTGRDFIGIEKESEYFKIAKRRINDIQNNRSK
jgi:site-specific DNA-methyltransferase (adenine-specific)